MSNRKYCMHTLAKEIYFRETVNGDYFFIFWCPSCGSYQETYNSQAVKIDNWINPKGVYNKENWQRKD